MRRFRRPRRALRRFLRRRIRRRLVGPRLEFPAEQPEREAEIERRAEGQGEESSGSLPPRCPHCGGPVNPDKLDWVDSRTAECAYCGSILRTS